MSITQGNVKLGMLVWGWSLPVLKSVCIGATALCAKLCYATKGFFAFNNVKTAHAANYEESMSEDFVQRMNTDIRRNFVSVVRVHVGGDFYSVEYVNKWLAIARANPASQLYAYTRSWRDPVVRKALLRLAREPNFQLWWSCDMDTGKPPVSMFVQSAYLSIKDSDVPRYKVDLVFRSSQTTVMKYTPRGELVCPYDNGVTKTTCSQCKLCFNNKPVPVRTVRLAAPALIPELTSV
mgnify:FL=1